MPAQARGRGPDPVPTGAGPGLVPTAGRVLVLGRTTDAGVGCLAGALSTSRHSDRTTTQGHSGEDSTTGGPSDPTTEAGAVVVEGSSTTRGASAGF